MSDLQNKSLSLVDSETLSILKQEGNFDIAPLNEQINLADKSQFTKIKLTPSETSQLSALMSQLPATIASGTMSNLYTVRFPQGMPHTLTQLKQGGVGSMIKGADGKYVGSASFYQLTTPAVVMAAFTAMSIASSQFFLAQINKRLDVVHLKIDKIIEFLYGEKRAELISEITFVRYAYQNYQSMMNHANQCSATISSLQESRKIAMKDIEFYIGDMERYVAMDSKNADEMNDLVKKTMQTAECLNLSIQLFIVSSVLEMYYSQNMDTEFVKFLESDCSYYIDKCEKRMFAAFSVLKHRVSDFKAKLPIQKELKHKDALEKDINEQIDLLSNSELSENRKTLRSAFDAVNQMTEYIVKSDGSVYMRTAV